jgi:hypothetical protein
VNEIEITVTVFNVSDLDYIEAMDLIGVILATPNHVYSGITDVYGSFKAMVPPSMYFMSIVDPALSPTTGQLTYYLCDYPIRAESFRELDVRVQIDTSAVESDQDILGSIQTTVSVVSKPLEK